MKTQMKTTRALVHISKPRVVFICLLTGHQDLWIKTKQIEHLNNALASSLKRWHPYLPNLYSTTELCTNLHNL